MRAILFNSPLKIAVSVEKMNNHEGLKQKENSILYLDNDAHAISSVCYSTTAPPCAKLREDEKKIQSVRTKYVLKNLQESTFLCTYLDVLTLKYVFIKYENTF